MKLAYSSNAYKLVSLEAALDSIGSLGYAGAEIMADVPHAYPPLMDPARIARILEQLRGRKLAVSNVNAFTLFARGDTYHPTWIEDDAALRRVRIEHTCQCVTMAAELGARTISLQPGGPLLDERQRGAALDRFESGLREVLPLARQKGVILAIEPEPGLLIQESGECLDFLKRFNDPFLRMNADLGHFYCVGEDPASVLLKAAGQIAHVHLEDIAESRVHQHLVPGRGGMDFAAIFSALRQIRYDGWVTVELYPYESTAEEAGRQALEFLRGLGFGNGE